jgi:hypothetical protein
MGLFSNAARNTRDISAFIEKFISKFRPNVGVFGRGQGRIHAGRRYTKLIDFAFGLFQLIPKIDQLLLGFIALSPGFCETSAEICHRHRNDDRARQHPDGEDPKKDAKSSRSPMLNR